MTTTPTGENRPPLPPQAERHQAALTIGTAALGLLEDVCLGREPATSKTLEIIASGLRGAGDLVQGLSDRPRKPTGRRTHENQHPHLPATRHRPRTH